MPAIESSKFEPRVPTLVNSAALQVQYELDQRWKQLLWDPTIQLPQGEVVGVEAEHSEDNRSILYVGPGGKIWQQTPEKPPYEPDTSHYFRLGASLERKLFQIRRDQLREMMQDPEGRDVKWRPGQVLAGYMYGTTRGFSSPIRVVRFKRAGLYCTTHPDKLLQSTLKPTQTPERYLVCPEDDRHFGVYIGT